MSSLRILHIHSDYPDGVQGFPSTKAVYNLILNSKGFEHYVVSINRVANPFKIGFRKEGNVFVFNYFGVPVSFFYFVFLHILRFWILIRLKDYAFDVVHSHKATTDAFVGDFIASKKVIPHVISIRGGTDVHNFNKYRLFSIFFKNVLNSSEHCFFVSPWVKSVLTDKYNIIFDSYSILPNICDIDEVSPDFCGYKPNAFCTVLSFHQYKRKKVIELIDVVSSLKKKGVDITLDIFGGGSEHIEEILKLHIIKSNVADRVFLKGKIDNRILLEAFKLYNALLLPSVDETFGMVYIEALSVGTPILYTKGTGIDGYLPKNIGCSTYDSSIVNLEFLINKLITQSDVFHKDIKSFLEGGGIDFFKAGHVSESYSLIINDIVGCFYE